MPGQNRQRLHTYSAGWQFFVAVDGDDSGDGSRSHPFATLERAREALRARKATASLPPGGERIWLRGGDYPLLSSFVLDAADSGAPGRPVVIGAWHGERVRLLGGQVIRGFQKVTDLDVLERLDPAARAHVLELDLAALGIRDFGRLRSRGFSRPAAPAHLELFFGGRAMQLARWPNSGFATIAEVGVLSADGDGHGGSLGMLEDGFHYHVHEDRPARWKSAGGAWIHGYWAWDWANSYEEIDSINLEKRLIRTKPPHGNYGFRTGQRIQYLNVLEELDAPGEYYVDAKKGKLYFWPPARLDAGEALVSLLETPLVAMQQASHIVLQDLTLEAGRGFGLEITGGTGICVEQCRILNMGSHAISINGGKRHRIATCEIAGCGDSGIEVSGGDRKALTACGHQIEGSHIHHFGRWSRCYVPAVHATGVGIGITRNHIHDAPHSAIIYQGNEIVIDGNDIHHICTETDDCGAIYTGRDFTARGNLIRHNRIADVRGCKSLAIGVYMDDCASGQTIEANIFEHCKVAVVLGGGRDLAVRNNILVECETGVWIDGRGLNSSPVWHDMIYVTMRERYDEMRPGEEPYSRRYPELRELVAFFARDDGVPPKIELSANITVGGPLCSIQWGAEAQHVTFGENLEGIDPGFVDLSAGDYRLRKDAAARLIGFKPVRLSQRARDLRVRVGPHPGLA